MATPQNTAAGDLRARAHRASVATSRNSKRSANTPVCSGLKNKDEVTARSASASSSRRGDPRRTACHCHTAYSAGTTRSVSTPTASGRLYSVGYVDTPRGPWSPLRQSEPCGWRVCAGLWLLWLASCCSCCSSCSWPLLPVLAMTSIESPRPVHPRQTAPRAPRPSAPHSPEG